MWRITSHQSAGYEKVPSTESGNPLISTKRYIRTRDKYVFLFLCVIAILVIITVTAALTKHIYQPQTRAKETCGSTIAEAQARGCIYDPLTVYWMPAACERSHADEFVTFAGDKPWQYWEDQAGTIPISNLRMRPGETYFTTEKEHLAHCAFLLMRLADVFRTGKRVDYMTGHFEHSKHCAQMLLNASMASPTIDKINSFGEVRFGSC